MSTQIPEWFSRLPFYEEAGDDGKPLCRPFDEKYDVDPYYRGGFGYVMPVYYSDEQHDIYDELGGHPEDRRWPLDKHKNRINNNEFDFEEFKEVRTQHDFIKIMSYMIHKNKGELFCQAFNEWNFLFTHEQNMDFIRDAICSSNDRQMFLLMEELGLGTVNDGFKTCRDDSWWTNIPWHRYEESQLRDYPSKLDVFQFYFERNIFNINKMEEMWNTYEEQCHTQYSWGSRKPNDIHIWIREYLDAHSDEHSDET